MVEQVDAIVVGLGVGGEEVAGRLAEAGWSVVGIENRLVGGECPYWACVPTKMMIRAADALAEGRRVPELAGASTIDPDWRPVALRIRQEATDTWDDKVAVDRLEGKGARFVRGSARVSGRLQVTVGAETFQATRALVLATGSDPSAPPIEGLADTPHWTNRQAVETEQVPPSLTVIGGGAVGVEFTQVFSRFGSAVTLLEAAPNLLPNEEPEAGELVADVLGRAGVRVVAGAQIQNVSYDGEFKVALAGTDDVRSTHLLVATGRRADLARLGVGAAGLDENARFIEVDENLCAGDRVWAVGDVTGKGLFTHVAMYQARIAVADMLGQPHEPADYRAVPRVTFTDPEVGAVGMTEKQAREADVDVRVATAQIPSSARGWIHKVGNEGFIKLVVDNSRDVLVGATSVGPVGGEVLGALAVAVHAEVPVQRLHEMIYAYPTFHRAIEDALRELQ